MLVKMITHASGPDFNAAPGEERVVDDIFGQALVDGGYAELICDVWTPEAEAAAAAPAAKAPAQRRAKAVAQPQETR